MVDKSLDNKKNSQITLKHPKISKKKKSLLSSTTKISGKIKVIEKKLHSADFSDTKKMTSTEKKQYFYATGRRKSSIANIRLFAGKGENTVNKKSVPEYFKYLYHQEEAISPFNLTGLYKNYYFTAQISGGGIHSQAQALKNSIASALANISLDVRKILKKNGLLKRDDRIKERKKPGLKRARRAPQWAKR